MTSNCSYCGCSFEGASKCESCGAPTQQDAAAGKDFRSCPYCARRLLALASPSCSYCGRRLPEDYIEAREADLKRIAAVSSGSDDPEANRKVGELIRHNAREGREESLLDILTARNFTDLL